MTPKQITTDDRRRLIGIVKRGTRYLREPLIHDIPADRTVLSQRCLPILLKERKHRRVITLCRVPERHVAGVGEDHQI